MYCSHCGKKIDENKIEKQKNSFTLANAKEDTKINYVCPQCGHLIHEDLSKEEIKSLSRASHAQLQRSSNSIASGMSFTALGIILLVVASIFFILAKKTLLLYSVIRLLVQKGMENMWMIIKFKY